MTFRRAKACNELTAFLTIAPTVLALAAVAAATEAAADAENSIKSATDARRPFLATDGVETDADILQA